MDFSSLMAPRLVEERKRLSLNQEEAGDACNVSREMWGKYERGKAAMGTEVLARFGVAGADIQYVLTGNRQGQGIGESAVHQAVLDAVDLLSLEKKVDALQLAKAIVKLAARNSEWAKLAVPPLDQARNGSVSAPAPAKQVIQGSLQVFHKAPTGTVVGRDLVKKERK